MPRHKLDLSDPAMEALNRVYGKLLAAFDAGNAIGPWKPSQSKVVEMGLWLYEQLCEKHKLEIGDITRFVPITAPQGRHRLQPTMHQTSLATKMLIESLQREPSETEVRAFLKRNPDIGVDFEKRRLENEVTRAGILARGPLPNVTMRKNSDA